MTNKYSPTSDAAIFSYLRRHPGERDEFVRFEANLDIIDDWRTCAHCGDKFVRPRPHTYDTDTWCSTYCALRAED